MFQFKHDFEDDYRSARDVETARRLNPDLQSFGEWLRRHGDAISVG
jgi:hypothetical protein